MYVSLKIRQDISKLAFLYNNIGPQTSVILLSMFYVTKLIIDQTLKTYFWSIWEIYLILLLRKQ